MKYLLITLAFLISISSISALNCTYTEMEKFQELKLGIYNSDGSFYGEPLILKDFASVTCWRYSSCPEMASFVIENSISTPVNLNLTATLINTGQGGSVDVSQEIFLPPYKSYTFKANVIGWGQNYFQNDSITYTFINSSLVLKKEMRQSEREVCDGLNDGENCTEDSICGSRICSGMGVCSKFRDDCASNGLSLCNKKCVTRESKSFGEIASCEFECKSGFIESGKCKTCSGVECLKDGITCGNNNQCGSGICNSNNECGSFDGICKGNTTLCNVTNKCVLPSSKGFGEAYSCTFECKSDRWTSEKCLMSSSTLKVLWTSFVVLVLVIILVSYWKFKKQGADKAEKERREHENKRDEAKDELGKLDKKIESDKKALQELNETIGKAAVEIASLKEEIEKSKGRAREKLEEELKKQLERQSKRITQIKLKDAKINYEERKVLEKEKDIKKRNEFAEGEILATKKEIEAAKEKYGLQYGKDRIWYDEKTGYLKFTSNNEPLHRYIYRTKTNSQISFNSEVHHIDNKKINDDFTNLLELTKDEHLKINHGKIKVGNWLSGINEIKRALYWQDSDFPKHIQEKIRKKE